MGFCFFNNAAIAARYAQKKYGAEHVAVVDFDLHHGNGTQDIFWDDPSVMYCSNAPDAAITPALALGRNLARTMWVTSSMRH